jgi:hypothetical protein
MEEIFESSQVCKETVVKEGGIIVPTGALFGE